MTDEIACCPDQIFKTRHGLSARPSRSQLEMIREDIRRLRGHVCMPIENTQDALYREDVCMSQTRSDPAPLHDCSPGWYNTDYIKFKK